MTGNTFRLSSRLVLELLAGRTSYAAFQELHGWSERADSPEWPGPFVRALEDGQRISVARVVDGDEDDDWLEFTFDSDPAISSFK